MRHSGVSTPAELIKEVGKYFTPTTPIDEKSLFAGRGEQITNVVDAINQKGQHAILFGERGVGKTSLANVLGSFLMSSMAIVSPRINCESSDTFESLFRKAFSEIDLVKQRREFGFTGKTTPIGIKAESLLSVDVTPDSVRKALTILGDIALPIIIFDEFDRLREQVKHSMADAIKAFSDHNIKATIVLVGVADSVTDLIREHASVERALVQIRMPRMSDDETVEILQKASARLGTSFDEDSQSRILVLSQGLPHYTHLIGLHSTRKALEAGRLNVTLADIDAAIEKAIKSTQASIQSLYHTATMSPRVNNLFADVLLACALAKTDEIGYFAAQDVREPMRGITGKNYEIPSFSQHLNEFTESKRGPILQKIGTPRRYRFRFLNPLLQPYVIMRGYENNKVTFMDDEGQQEG